MTRTLPDMSLRAPNVTLYTPRVSWSLLDQEATWIDSLAETEPALPPLVRALADTLPCQDTWGFGECGAYIRPDRHARAFYLRLAKVEGAVSQGGCIAIKGGEAACQNFDSIIRRLRGMWNILGTTFGDTSRAWYDDWAMISSLERYPLAEGKPPGVVSHADAVEEARLALQIQKAHRARYGHFARLPIPLFAYAWPEETSDRIWLQLRPHLSPALLPLVKAQLSAGLGAYVYYYPRLPLRAEHLPLPDVGPEMSYDAHFAELGRVTNPKEVISSWLLQTARLLCLGFVPTPAASMGRGYCIQSQNAVLDGGFVDLGGLQRVEDFHNVGDVTFAVSRTIQILAQTIGRFLIGAGAASNMFPSRVPAAGALVWAGIRHHISREIATGGAVPRAIADVFADRDPAEDILRMFSQLFSFEIYRTEDKEKRAFGAESDP